MKHKFILPLLAFLIVGLSHTGVLAQSNKAPDAKMGEEILKLVNDYRASKHLKALKANAEIAHEAQGHSNNMATGKTPFSHDGFEGRVNRLKKKVPQTHSSAENVAYGAHTAREVVDMWLKSDGHRKNIEGEYNLTGIGIAKGKNGTYYFTQIFLGN